MRPKVSFILLIALLTGACTESDCLPQPEFDPSPPEVRVMIEYSSPSGGRQSVEHTSGDSTETIVGDRQSPVTIIFAASDSSGVRSLAPSIGIQQTVGIGVERSSVNLDPITARCPLRELSYRHEIRATGMRRSLMVTAVAQNWVGLTSFSDLITIRLE